MLTQKSSLIQSGIQNSVSLCGQLKHDFVKASMKASTAILFQLQEVIILNEGLEAAILKFENIIRPFSLGGRKRAPFPINIECSKAENADALIQLLQPIADKYHEKPYTDVFAAIATSKRWSKACQLMQSQAIVFYAVALGKHVGIFIDRQCDRFSTFNGAYMSMASNGSVTIDYMGQGLGDESVNEDLSDSDLSDCDETGRPPSMPYSSPLAMPPSTPRRRQNVSATPTSPLAHGSTHISIGLSPSLHIKVQGSDVHSDVRSPQQTPLPTRVPRQLNFGPWFSLYFETHRFSSDITAIAESLFRQFQSSETGFIDAFTAQVENVEAGEALYIFRLMSERPGIA
ncbi:hypothetical protein H0H93_012293 [Arthromyces matolae]|nr:hypothetical protein H0H93_012293 [Arthromyces matolae]